MSHEFNNDTTLADAYRELDAIVHDDYFTTLVDGEGPLELTELDADLLQSPAFRQFVEEYGWPNSAEDGNIVPLPRFENDDQFREAFTQGTIVNGRNYHLNNFKVWLASEPNTDRFSGGTKFYGSVPALLRAYAIAPKFMEGLRVTYDALPKRTHYASEEALASPSAEQVVHGAHMAYRLLGRLVKTDDRMTHAKTLFGERSGELIDDAAMYLAE